MDTVLVAILVAIVGGVIAGVILLAVEYWTGLFSGERTDKRSVSNFVAHVKRTTLNGYRKIRQNIQISFKENFFYSLAETVVLLFALLFPLYFFTRVVVYSQENPNIGDPFLLNKTIAKASEQQIGQVIATSYLLAICSSAVTWCLIFMIYKSQSRIEKLRAQIDYLNRMPGVEQLRKSYDHQLYETVREKWSDFLLTLRAQYRKPSLAGDLATCVLLRVENETLVIGCSSNLVRNRINSSKQSDKDYRESIHKHLKKYFNKPDRIWCEEVTQSLALDYEAEVSSVSSSDGA